MPTGNKNDTASSTKARDAQRSANWTITRYASLDEMKADEYRYWRRRPAYVRLGAISELTRDAYGEEAGSPDVPRFQRPFVRVERK